MLFAFPVGEHRPLEFVAAPVRPSVSPPAEAQAIVEFAVEIAVGIIIHTVSGHFAIMEIPLVTDCSGDK